VEDGIADWFVLAVCLVAAAMRVTDDKWCRKRASGRRGREGECEAGGMGVERGLDETNWEGRESGRHEDATVASRA